MAGLAEKLVFGVIAITIAIYVLINAFVPAVNGTTANLTSVQGTNYNWALGIVIILVFAGVALGTWKHFMGSGK